MTANCGGFVRRESWELRDKAAPNRIPSFFVSLKSVVKIHVIATCFATVHPAQSGPGDTTVDTGGEFNF
jgi:hypothetical protein